MLGYCNYEEIFAPFYRVAIELLYVLYCGIIENEGPF